MKEKETNILKELIEDGIIFPSSTVDGGFWCYIKDGKAGKSYPLFSDAFRVAFKAIYKKQYGEILSKNQFTYLLDELEVLAFENKLDYPLAKRICRMNEAIIYDLQEAENRCMRIAHGKCEITQTPKLLFKRTNLSLDQVAPKLSTDPATLPKMLKKHLNINKKTLELYCIWLVTCFIPDIQHPILVAFGEKGSSKSTLLQRTVQILDPQIIALNSLPKPGDLELRLSSTYVCAFDNLQQLRNETSNLLCQTVTGGASAKRKFYTDSELVITDIQSIVLLNGTDLIISKSDLMERSLLIPMKKLSPERLQSEIELSQAFDAELSSILGACFQLLAMASNDTKPIETGHRTRIASFYDAAIRVGRALGFEDIYTDKLLWINQKRINQEALSDSVIAQCLNELMLEETEYKNSVTGLLNDIKEIGEELGIPLSEFPKQPNQMSKRLNELKSNLESEYGISYKICNIGRYKEIRITKKQESDSTDEV